MSIEVRTLSFDHLIVHETTERKTEWQEAFFLMENFTLNEEIYKNGPVFFSVKTDEKDETMGHFTYYLPINEAVQIAEHPDFRYLDRFQIERALVLRQADEELEFKAAYEKLQAYAVHNAIELEDTYYCVLLEVYGEYIVDLYVPFKGTGR